MVFAETIKPVQRKGNADQNSTEQGRPVHGEKGEKGTDLFSALPIMFDAALEQISMVGKVPVNRLQNQLTANKRV